MYLNNKEPDESKKLFKKVFLAFITLCAFYLLGLIKGCIIGFFHSFLTPKLYLVLFVITCATFSLTFMFLIPKKERDKILKPILCIAVITISILLFSSYSKKTIVTDTQPFKINLYHGIDLKYNEKQYLEDVREIAIELNSNIRTFEVTSICPEFISKEFIDIQIDNHERIIAQLNKVKPPKSFYQDHQILYCIALLQLDNLIKYKNNIRFETVVSDRYIRDVHQEKGDFLRYYLVYKVNEM